MVAAVSLPLYNEPEPEALPSRPRTRAECAPEGDGPFAERPCPFVSCRHHLALVVTGGVVRMAFPDREVWELLDTCSLDVAARDASTLQEIADRIGVTRERVRQIEASGLERLRAACEHEGVRLEDLIPGALDVRG